MDVQESLSLDVKKERVPEKRGKRTREQFSSRLDLCVDLDANHNFPPRPSFIVKACVSGV